MIQVLSPARKWWRELVLALFAYALPALATAEVPTKISASYDLLKNGQHVGVIQEQFERTGDSYSIVSETRLLGVLGLVPAGRMKVTSRGAVAARGLRPAHFEQARGTDTARDTSATFDWSNGSITLQHGGTVETLPLPAGTQDRLSVMYQFMFLQLARLPALEFPMTNGSKVDLYRYDVHRGQSVATPAARFNGVHLVKQRTPEQTGTEIWLAEQRNFFPVRVVNQEHK